MEKLDTMTVEDLMEFFGISEARIYTLVGQGKLPRPFRFGKKNTWLTSSIKKVVLDLTQKSESNLRYKKGVL